MAGPLLPPHKSSAQLCSSTLLASSSAASSCYYYAVWQLPNAAKPSFRSGCCQESRHGIQRNRGDKNPGENRNRRFAICGILFCLVVPSKAQVMFFPLRCPIARASKDSHLSWCFRRFRAGFQFSLKSRPRILGLHKPQFCLTWGVTLHRKLLGP